MCAETDGTNVHLITYITKKPLDYILSPPIIFFVIEKLIIIT